MKSWVYTHETHARIYVIQQRKAFECQTNRPTPMPPAEHWAMHTQDRKSLSSEYHCKDSKKKKKWTVIVTTAQRKQYGIVTWTQLNWPADIARI